MKRSETRALTSIFNTYSSLSESEITEHLTMISVSLDSAPGPNSFDKKLGNREGNNLGSALLRVFLELFKKGVLDYPAPQMEVIKELTEELISHLKLPLINQRSGHYLNYTLEYNERVPTLGVNVAGNIMMNPNFVKSIVLFDQYFAKHEGIITDLGFDKKYNSIGFILIHEIFHMIKSDIVYLNGLFKKERDANPKYSIISDRLLATSTNVLADYINNQTIINLGFKQLDIGGLFSDKFSYDNYDSVKDMITDYLDIIVAELDEQEDEVDVINMSPTNELEDHDEIEDQSEQPDSKPAPEQQKGSDESSDSNKDDGEDGDSDSSNSKDDEKDGNDKSSGSKEDGEEDGDDSGDSDSDDSKDGEDGEDEDGDGSGEASAEDFDNMNKSFEKDKKDKDSESGEGGEEDGDPSDEESSDSSDSLSSDESSDNDSKADNESSQEQLQRPPTKIDPNNLQESFSKMEFSLSKIIKKLLPVSPEDEYEETYSKIGRGTLAKSALLRDFGSMQITPGTRLSPSKENPAFLIYIDCSGSMSSVINELLVVVEKVLKKSRVENFYIYGNARRDGLLWKCSRGGGLKGQFCDFTKATPKKLKFNPKPETLNKFFDKLKATGYVSEFLPSACTILNGLIKSQGLTTLILADDDITSRSNREGYKNLLDGLKATDEVFFGLVSESRWGNEYGHVNGTLEVIMDTNKKLKIGTRKLRGLPTLFKYGLK